MRRLRTIESALRDGYELSGFRSGGGLRVLSLKKNKDFEPLRKSFYGEGVDYSMAMERLLENIWTPRPYEKTYGKRHPHYLTGKYPWPRDTVDVLMYQGFNLDAFSLGRKICVIIKVSHQLRTPKLVVEEVQTEQHQVHWKRVGKPEIYVTSPYRFANGTIGCSTKVLGGGNVESFKDIAHKGISMSYKESLRIAINSYKNFEEPEWYHCSPPVQELAL